MTVPLVPMIPAMPPQTEAFPILAVLTIATASFLGGCAAPPPGSEVPLLEGLARYGTVTEAWAAVEADSAVSRLEIVVLKDRHAVHGAITRERGPLFHIQRENRGAIGFLALKGYALLGCEAALGPLPDDTHGPASAHRAAVREALAGGDRLHGLTVYQPIRYEEEFRGVLTVLGMEDPDLYQEDADRLEDIISLRRIASRADIDADARRDAIRAMLANMKAISSQVDARGRAAACNLIETMLIDGHRRAILMLGGAHARGALEQLMDAGVTVHLFECRSYGAR